MVKFGVSPAFIVSLYGTQFSVDDFCNGLDVVKELGFEIYQPEIFVADQLKPWVDGGAEKISRKGETLGLRASQFVAHFMHAHFANPEIISSDSGLEDLKQVVELVGDFPECNVLTIPVLPFESGGSMTVAQYDDIQKRLVDKIRMYLDVITAAGFKFAFEIVPFSIIGNIDRFLAICQEIASPSLGLNLDTGHAWATRDWVHLLPLKLKDRIFGLHLKDNNSDQNLPLAPGKGTISWQYFLENLAKIGYLGSLDIEIGCDGQQVRQEYKSGLDYLKKILVKSEN